MQSTMAVRSGIAFSTQSSARPRPARRSVVTMATSSDPILQKPAAKPAEAKPAEPATASHSAAAAPAATSSGVTIEYQRQQAKAMQKYFQSLKYEQAVEKSKVFGWTKANEIGNGRWVMMGLAIGLITEYGTGVSFIGQLQLMASYLGIVDLDY